MINRMVRIFCSDTSLSCHVARMVLRAGPPLLSCNASPECLDRAHRDKILPKKSHGQHDPDRRAMGRRREGEDHRRAYRRRRHVVPVRVANGGHTAFMAAKKYILIYSIGDLRRGKVCVIGNGVVVDPVARVKKLRLRT